MSRRLSPTNSQPLPHVYTEEERRRRWSLIIQILLHAAPPDARQKRLVMPFPLDARPEQTPENTTSRV